MNEIVQDALNQYFKAEVVNDNDLLSNWKLDERKKIDFRYGKSLNFTTEDAMEIRNNEISEIFRKYENNRSKKNIAVIIGHFVRILHAQQKYEEYAEEEESKIKLLEKETAERLNQLKERIRLSIEESEEEEKTNK